MRPFPICIPLHHGGGKFKNDTELRYALRSIALYFKDPCEVVIVGRKLPDWIRGVRHIHVEKGLGLKSALKAAAAAYPDGFFWYYDDCCLLRPTTAEEMKITPACKSFGRVQTKWGGNLDKIRVRLKKEGYVPVDYSRPHGPYWFNKEMIDQAFEDWPGMEGKFPFETWILSKICWPKRHGVVRQYYGPFLVPPKESHAFLNYADNGNTPQLRAWLDTAFPVPCRYEEGCAVSVEVHTIRFGEKWWVRFCGDTLDAWCARHGHKLRVWKEGDINPAYPAAKFCEVDMLREFLAGQADWLLYVDADVYVSEDAPAMFEIPDGGGFLIHDDNIVSLNRRWDRWCRNRWGDKAAICRGWKYKNAGVWACDRDSAARMLAVIEEPYHARVQEQHHWNWWLCLAHHGGMKMPPLPVEWNSYPWRMQKAAFHHIAGKNKLRKVTDLRKAGLIPMEKPPNHRFTMAFDFEPYRFTLVGPSYAPMDEYHIQLLHMACGIQAGTPLGEKVAVEIGSFNGASTSALVEAVNKGWLAHLHIVELRPNSCLRRVISMCKFPERITLHTRPYWETDIGRADLVFIDGDHKWPAVGDTLRALTWGCPVICMHDTQAYKNGYPDLWGSCMAAGMLKSMEDRHFFEDEEVREGMATHRGFLVSVPRSYPLDVFSGVECRVDSTDIALSQPDDAEGADHVAPINAIVMLHRGSLDLMDVAGPLWAANGRRVIAVANHDCPRDYPWAERVIVWDTDPGHIGHEHCKRLLAAVDEAARLEGPTAISEADGFLVHDFPVEPGCFYGSERFDTRKTKSIIASPYCEISAFCPWVTDQAGWQAIAKVMRAWCDSENFPDQGYADRVITAAAVDSGLKVNGIGYNRFPCILPSDKEALQAAVSAGKSPLVHGIKAPDVLEWIFTD